MRTVPVNSFAIAAAFLTVAGSAAAQEKPKALLTTVEVQQLVAHAEPADNARLSTHFTVLAQRYAAEANRHLAMSQSFVGNPSRSFGSGMSAHCKRLADLNNQEAATVRELAAYHEKLAGGAPATPPRDGARFHAGAGAPEPTGQELNALAAKASAPAEHRALAEYFQTLSTRYASEANEHAALAQTYRGTRLAHAALHHDRLAELSRDAAKEATAAASMHKELAGIAR